ncbi:MAG TPA: glycyl-radical enzyme activating protein [Desulfitobacteriaceae bacterium]|nr:glycyl-radical enzyme activating protein [Desulfitobacteriaceae bacterium]
MSEQGHESRLVLSIMGTTIHNGPGIRTLVLLKGCPLRCAWCSTPESQSPTPEIGIFPDKCTRCGKCVEICPNGAMKINKEKIQIDRLKCNNCGECTKICYSEALRLYGRKMTVEELINEVKKDIIFYKHSGGGVVISGGEPLSEIQFIKEFAKACRAEGISLGVDTCGYVPRTNIEQMLEYIDYVLLDIKHMDSRRHKEITGVPNELIISNAQFISKMNVPIYIRVPVIPGYTDSEENIRAISNFAGSLHSLKEVHLMPIHHLGAKRYESLNRPYLIADIELIPQNTMESMKRLLESYGAICKIVG